MANTVTEDSFYQAGCLMTRHDITKSQDVGLRRFREYFGTLPAICNIIWNSFYVTQVHPHGSKPIHLLCALLFLNRYLTEAVNRAITGLDEKTFRKWSRIYIVLMATELYVVSILVVKAVMVANFD